MKNAWRFFCKILGVCAVIYVLCLIRELALRPDLRPAIRSLGESISGLYPEQKSSTVESKDNAERNERLIYEISQTPRN